VKIQQVAEELGVRYVLEGSVQKTENRVRITAQLIDAITGMHLWAERYDRELKDIFALQDEITMKIVTAMQVKLTEGEQSHLLAKGTKNLKAYLQLLQGLEHHRRGNIEDNALGRQLYEEAIALDPEYALAYAFLGITHVMDVWFGSSKSPKKSFAQAIKIAQKAISIDDSSAFAHGFLGYLYTMTRQYDKGIVECKRGVAINPNDASAQSWLGQSLYWADRAEEALPVLKKALRLDPISPRWVILCFLAMVYRDMGQYEEAITLCKKVLKPWPDNILAHLVLAASYSMSDRNEDARSEATEILRIDPNFSLERLERTRRRRHKNRENTARFVDALRKAGLK
jgi:adenylate cyclase